MTSSYEQFWTYDKYAFVALSSEKPFPELSYNAVKAMAGKTVYAVDPSADEIGGDKAYDELTELPEPVDAVVLEVPQEKTAEWVAKVADAGIGHLWIHMGRESPEALKLAEEKGIEVRHGTCAVQYVRGGFPHNLHKLFRKMLGRW